MAVGQEEIDRANAACTLAVRLAIESVAPPSEELGPAFVSGRVIEVLRGSDVFVGQLLVVQAYVLMHHRQYPRPGGTLWLRWAALIVATELEACLSPVTGAPDVYEAPYNCMSLVIPPGAHVEPEDSVDSVACIDKAARKSWESLRRVAIFVATMAASGLVAWLLTR